MANSLGIDLTGKTVLLTKRSLSEKYHADHLRAYKVTGGFGADPSLRGTAIMGYFVEDGDTAPWNGMEVERLAPEYEREPSPCQKGEHDQCSDTSSDAMICPCVCHA